VFDRNNNNRSYDQPPPPPGYGQGGQLGQQPAYGWNAPNTLRQDAGVITGPREGFLTMSFVWMFVALLVSAGAAWFVMGNTLLLRQIAGAWIVLFVIELALVLTISAGINRIGALPALALLFAYALINGLFLGVIVWAYIGAIGLPGVVSAFAGSAAIFAGAAVYGGVTKRDLTSLGGILFMGLIGLIVTSLVQVFLFPTSSTFSFIIGIVGVLIFTGLTAFDVQRIKEGRMPGVKNAESASVVGALALYLDFVNLFLLMLRIFGSSRN
jgi:FtsH-binding integral membrane protein